MKVIALAAILIALTALPARADPVRDGAAAFSRGDYQRAAKKFRRPAHHGEPVAQAYLGFLYQTGSGVPQHRLAPPRGISAPPSRAIRPRSTISGSSTTRATACRRTTCWRTNG